MCCARGTAVDRNSTTTSIYITKKRGEKTKKKRPESKEIKEIQEGSPTNNIIVGNHRLRRAERWENIPRVSSKVGEIYVSLFLMIYYRVRKPQQ